MPRRAKKKVSRFALCSCLVDVSGQPIRTPPGSDEVPPGASAHPQSVIVHYKDRKSCEIARDVLVANAIERHWCIYAIRSLSTSFDATLDAEEVAKALASSELRAKFDAELQAAGRPTMFIVEERITRQQLNKARKQAEKHNAEMRKKAQEAAKRAKDRAAFEKFRAEQKRALEDDDDAASASSEDDSLTTCSSSSDEEDDAV